MEKQVDLPVNNFKPSSFGKLECLQLRLKFGKKGTLFIIFVTDNELRLEK